MANWLERARREISKTTIQGTAVTAERNPMAVLAVSKPGDSEISNASNRLPPAVGHGKTLTDTDRQEAKRQAASQPEQPAVDSIIDDRTVAILIDSTVLGCPIWFAMKEGWTPGPEDEKHPVFYASELPALRTKSAEQLRSIFNVKHAFGGGIVRQ